jgi:hypothetical protein
MDTGYYVMIGIFLAAMVLGPCYAEYAKKECRIEAIKAHTPAAEIEKICK